MDTFLLKPTGIEIKTGNTQLPQLNFSPQAVQNQEILDQVLLEKELTSYLNTVNIKKTSIDIIIAKELIYQKKIKKGESEESFLSVIPLKENEISKIKIEDKDGWLLVATNKYFYETICNILKKLGWHINKIQPEGINANFTEINGKSSRSTTISVALIIFILLITLTLILITRLLK